MNFRLWKARIAGQSGRGKQTAPIRPVAVNNDFWQKTGRRHMHVFVNRESWFSVAKGP